MIIEYLGFLIWELLWRQVLFLIILEYSVIKFLKIDFNYSWLNWKSA